MRIAYFTHIVMRGNSYCITIPKEIRTIIEADRGDLLRIEVEKIDTNLHDDNAARQNPEARNKGIYQDA